MGRTEYEMAQFYLDTKEKVEQNVVFRVCLYISCVHSNENDGLLILRIIERYK